MKKAIVISVISIACFVMTACGQNSSGSVNDSSDAANVSSDAVNVSSDVVADISDTADTAAIDNSLISNYNLFEVTSDNLHNGKWDDVISYTDKGSNVSPSLSWEPVEGASSYMVYMVDTSMDKWIHWKSSDITETYLPEGWASTTEYMGPYPPAGGTHTYEIYVIALKNPIERMKGALNSQNPKFDTFIEAADTDVNGNTGNIVGAAHLVGTFTN